jgi:hypothetical protein
MIPATLNITAVEQVGDYALRLSFDDATVQTVDFKPFLSLSRHPDIRAYLDPARFAAFRIEYGELVWGDYDLCFPLADLYQNRLMPDFATEEAAKKLFSVLAQSELDVQNNRLTEQEKVFDSLRASLLAKHSKSTGAHHNSSDRQYKMWTEPDNDEDEQ